ncbi:hypothetical protein PDR5_43380 [Pseudomonas sp. DR 5-09]|nr:hypothetical protein PDR5_43380 [Pseudomonas sp. DR 5-09]
MTIGAASACDIYYATFLLSTVPQPCNTFAEAKHFRSSSTLIVSFRL